MGTSVTGRVWRIAPHDTQAVRSLSQNLRVSPLMAQVLLRRGCRTPEQASLFLGKKLGDLHDPETMPGL